MTRRIIVQEMNRVEGDLEVKLELDADTHTIVDAWCVGTMYRGFEQLLVGREPQDAMVITPRICGICSTSHLYAATTAIETAFGCEIAPNGTRIRNLCLMAETVQNDARHSFLMFAPDLCNHKYARHPLFAKIVETFEPPFRGRLARETVHNSKQILGIVIAFGGQWPHATYMMPGGVTAPLSRIALSECLALIEAYVGWYERSVLGCSFDRWSAVTTLDELLAWVEESPRHADSALGLFVRFGRDLGLHRTGLGSGNMLSAGSYYDAERWQPPFTERHCLRGGGFYDGATGELTPFDASLVSEDITHAWYADGAGHPTHPSESVTSPSYPSHAHKYTFAKATRYDDRVVELGPLSDLVAAADPLVTSCFLAEGANTWLRQLTRLHRPVRQLIEMRSIVIDLMRRVHEPTYIKATLGSDGDGVGLINAARGTLGHWLSVRDGRIARYQVITPTTWNASPRDAGGRRGHWEESFIGLEIEDFDNPVELGHVVRAHDACLVCTVHAVNVPHRWRFGTGATRDRDR